MNRISTKWFIFDVVVLSAAVSMILVALTMLIYKNEKLILPLVISSTLCTVSIMVLIRIIGSWYRKHGVIQ